MGRVRTHLVHANRRPQCCCTRQIQANPTAGEGQAGSGSSVVQEESEVKWGALLGVVALTTNQPYFATVVATGDRKRPWVLSVSCPLVSVA
jgi:hypothetical protein